MTVTMSHSENYYVNRQLPCCMMAAVSISLEAKYQRGFGPMLSAIDHPSIKEVRGHELFIGMELNEQARPYFEQLKEKGLLCKENTKP